MTLVAGQNPKDINRSRERRGGAAVAASIVVHVTVLAIIGLNVPRPVYRQPPPTQPVNVWLMPRVTLQQHRAAAPVAVQSAPRPIPTAKAAQPAPRPSPIQSVPAPSAQARVAPSPGAARPAPPPGVGADTGQGVREALRTTVGCDADRVVHLTPAEQARCNQSVGEMAKKQPPFEAMDPLKRGRYDAQAEADERRRANREGMPPPGIAPCTGEGSNFGVGCLPDSAIMHIPQH